MIEGSADTRCGRGSFTVRTAQRRTRAIIAVGKGLGLLADIILLQMTKKPLEEEAKSILSEEKEVKTVEEAIMVPERISLQNSISDEADYRTVSVREQWIREL